MKLKASCINKKFYQIVHSELKSSFYNELDECVHKVNACQTNRHKIIKATVFYDSDSFDDFKHKKVIINQKLRPIFQNNVLISCIPQKPLNNRNLLIELLFINVVNCEIKIEREHKSNENTNLEFLYIDNNELYAISELNDSSKIQNELAIDYCFASLKSELEQINFQFSDVIRQWSYIENINSINQHIKNNVDNYTIFNQIRAKYYSNNVWEFGYPAATGIGMDYGICKIELFATKPSLQGKIIALHNPNQLDAHSYSIRYADKSENTPKFERGKIYICDKHLEVYISGTAAIIGENSLGLNAEEQTIITINNIKELYSEENLKKHKIEFDCALPKLQYFRVYVKNQEDYTVVKQICETELKDSQIIYIKADVCRNELLVEIEAYCSYILE